MGRGSSISRGSLPCPPLPSSDLRLVQPPAVAEVHLGNADQRRLSIDTGLWQRKSLPRVGCSAVQQEENARVRRFGRRTTHGTAFPSDRPRSDACDFACEPDSWEVGSSRGHREERHATRKVALQSLDLLSIAAQSPAQGRNPSTPVRRAGDVGRTAPAPGAGLGGHGPPFHGRS